MTLPTQFLARDEGLLCLHRLDVTAEQPVRWSVPVPPGRDLHRIGEDAALLGTENGYEIRSLRDGALLAAETGFPGTLAAQPLDAETLLLTHLGGVTGKEIVLTQVDRQGQVITRLVYPGFDYVRLVRRTRDGNYLVPSNRELFEGTPDGKILWRSTVPSRVQDPHIWQALEVPDGRLLVAAGYAGQLQWYNRRGECLGFFSTPEWTRPYFFCDLRLLPAERLLLTNWQGHGPAQGGLGVQLLVLSFQGEVLWHWKQDAMRISSLQAVLPLEA